MSWVGGCWSWRVSRLQSEGCYLNNYNEIFNSDKFSWSFFVQVNYAPCLFGYVQWNLVSLQAKLVMFEVGSQDKALEVCSYPVHSTKYSNCFWWIWLLRILDISYSSSKPISIGGRGSRCQSVIVDVVAGSSRDTWNTGWIWKRSRGKPRW